VLGLFLRLERQLGGQEAVLLRHRRLGPVQHIRDQLLPVREGDIAAIDVARLLVVGEEEVIPARTSGEVDVAADLDVTVGAEQRKTAIAIRRQTVGRKPVDAKVAETAIAAQRRVAEILERGVLLVADVCVDKVDSPDGCTYSPSKESSLLP